MTPRLTAQHKIMNNWWNDGTRSGWIGTYEIELIRFLEQEFGNMTEEEKLCVVFSSLFLKAGHTSLPLKISPESWAKLLDLELESVNHFSNQPIHPSQLAESRIIGNGRDKTPFILENENILFRRIRNYEISVANWITDWESDKLSKHALPEISRHLDSLFKEEEPGINWQKVAALMSVIKPFLIISGGPGTGKTTTVARILALQLRLSGRGLSIALAAPTGKAAGRMGESLNRELKKIGLSDDEIRHIPKEAKTVHRLLSGTENRGLLPPVEKKVLRHDLVIVDEASMIDLTLMFRLISHLSEKTRLILLGDKDQLASVEAGSVFADLCQKPANQFLPATANLLEKAGIGKKLPVSEQSVIDDSIVYLTKSYRFDKNSGIGKLAEMINEGDSNPEVTSELFTSFDDLSHSAFQYNKTDFEKLLNGIEKRLGKCKELGHPEELLGFWKKSIWLAVLRRGLAGTERLNRLAEEQIAARRIAVLEQEWYHGRPVIITKNDYNLGVFNGDLGVCVRSEKGELWVHVESGSQIKRIKPQRLMHAEPAYFLTVHKSQGSEFEHVNLLLPAQDTHILTRELIYTAVTRSKNRFSLYGELSLFEKGISRKTVRFTGLKEKL